MLKSRAIAKDTPVMIQVDKCRRWGGKAYGRITNYASPYYSVKLVPPLNNFWPISSDDSTRIAKVKFNEITVLEEGKFSYLLDKEKKNIIQGFISGYQKHWNTDPAYLYSALQGAAAALASPSSSKSVILERV